jgi:lysophospholipase L1-like esterase
VRRLLLRCGLAGLSLALAFGLAEIAVRVLGPAGGALAHEHYYEDAQRQRTDLAAAVARGDVVVGDLPRNRARWARAHTFYLCYKDNPRPALDGRGCARVCINQFGLRDDENLTYEKPAGEWRLLCLGDSFTFGWGVDDADTWVRQIETKLAAAARVRAINCGAAGTLLVDEYWWGLRDRFHRFAPDMVLVTICLNDLVPMPQVLAMQRPPSALPGAGWSRLIAAAQRYHNDRNLLNLDPTVDWGDLLLGLPDRDEAAAALDPDRLRLYLDALGVRRAASDDDKRRFLVAYTQQLYERTATPAEAVWRNGGPQVALRAMRDWCAARDVRFAVVVWPLFQGLESAASYPFRTLHEVVAEFCAAEGIAHLDLLGVFLGRRGPALWCDPADMHANEAAHRLAAPAIADFVARVGGLPR